MDDKEKRRLNRQFAVTWFLLLLTILVTMFLAISRPRVETHNFVGAQGPKGEAMAGPVGPAGESIKGKDGLDGKDGSTTIIENTTIVHQTETVKGEKGDPGVQGEKGLDAPVLQIQINPENKDLEYKYSTDTFWTLLIPCIQLLKECDGNATE